MDGVARKQCGFVFQFSCFIFILDFRCFLLAIPYVGQTLLASGLAPDLRYPCVVCLDWICLCSAGVRLFHHAAACAFLSMAGGGWRFGAAPPGWPGCGCFSHWKGGWWRGAGSPPPPIQTRGHHVHGLVHESWTGLLDPVGSDHTAEGCGFGCGCGSS